MRTFARRVIDWQRRAGRHDLPWQNTRDAYRIWLAEIMLQQTQVVAVIPYYERFVARFPDVRGLAAAAEDEVLRLWSGLGYYARARNLHRAAQQIVERHGAVFPSDREQVQALPGIGRSTAAAICAFAYGARHAILDGNVKRVLARYLGIDGYPGERRTEDLLWAHAERLLPRGGIEAYTQGLMDLGTQVCTRRNPRCGECPVTQDCVAARDGLTGKLPRARPPKPQPQREIAMLVLMHAGQVLLEKRPAAGVWGGLWSFPEAAPRQLDVRRECRERFDIDAREVAALAPVDHGFTHFRLRITPWLVRAEQVRPCAGEPGRVWLDLHDAAGAAVPVPVRRILRALNEPVTLRRAPPPARPSAQ